MIRFLLCISNIFIYFILIRNFLPFRLKKHESLILLMILSANVINLTYISNLGNLGVVILLSTSGLYIALLDKHRIKNICFFLLSYLCGVLWDSIFTFCTTMIGLDFYFAQQNLLIRCIYIILLFFFSKGMAYIFHHIFVAEHGHSLPREVWISIFANLLICTIIFIFNIVAGERAGYDSKITTFNGILFGCYFFATTIVIINCIRSYTNRAEMERKQEAFDTLQQYTTQIENMYSTVRSFKHDYVNIMTSMSGYLEEHDLDGLSHYFYQEILPLSNQITMNDFRLNQLINIKLLEIKSIVSAKLTYAHEIGITVDIEIRDSVEKVAMDRLDLSRILGIFLDNAIEAALETEHPWIGFVMYQHDTSTSILISNSFIDHGISCSDFNKPSVSTKGSNRGIGLHNVSELIKNYPATIWENEVKDDIFIQKLEIHQG